MLPKRYGLGFKGKRILCMVIAALTGALSTWTGVNASTCDPEEGTDLDKHVVALRYQPTGQVAKIISGLLVSESGLVLTAGLLEDDFSALELLQAEINELEVDVWSEKIEEADAVSGYIVGHDAQRGLTLIKMKQKDVSVIGLEPARLSRLSGSTRPNQVRLIGYRKVVDRHCAHTTVPVSNEPGSRFFWTAEIEIPSTQVGGGVVDARNDTVLGIIARSDNNQVQLIPIEYADTLMSQVFIARIMKEMDNLKSISEEMKTGISWNFRDLPVPSEDPEDVRIRFYFKQHLNHHNFVKVRVSTWLVGTNEEGDRETNVPLRDNEFKDTLDVNLNYVDYSARRQIICAKTFGFKNLEEIRIKLKPIFKPAQDGRQPVASERSSGEFKFPISISLDSFELGEEEKCE